MYVACMCEGGDIVMSFSFRILSACAVCKEMCYLNRIEECYETSLQLGG